MIYRRGIARTIKALVNEKRLNLEFARVLYKSILILTLIYESETMIWKEKDSSRIRAVQMNNLGRIIVVRRSNRMRN